MVARRHRVRGSNAARARPVDRVVLVAAVAPRPCKVRAGKRQRWWGSGRQDRAMASTHSPIFVPTIGCGRREDVGGEALNEAFDLVGGHLPLPHSSRRARWMSWTHTEPSPTADATRLTLPDLTSPTAKTPGLLVSSRSGLRARGHPASSSSPGSRSAPVLTKSLPSNATHPFSHAVFGSAPVIRNR